MKNNICIILPYFGAFPTFFKFFIESCKKNSSVDFLIFTDNEIDFDVTSNIKIEIISWNSFVCHIQQKFDFKISLTRPYKLCDFKPAYGYIFSEYLLKYNYWGHCDCDLVFGNLNILNEIIKEQEYDRIGEFGHLILYKNDNHVNSWFKDLKAKYVPSYQKIYSSDKLYEFDEFRGMNILVKAHNKSCFTQRLFDDIIFYNKNFWSKRLNKEISTTVTGLRKYPMYIVYKNGLLLRRIYVKGTWIEDESLYAHFQKRSLTVETNDLNNYYVIPNRIISPNSISEDEILKSTKAPLFDEIYWKKMSSYYVKRLIKIIIRYKK